MYHPVRQYHEEIVNFESHEQWNLGGWLTLLRMAASTLWQACLSLLLGKKWLVKKRRVTTMVDAALVGKSENELGNQPILVET